MVISLELFFLIIWMWGWAHLKSFTAHTSSDGPCWALMSKFHKGGGGRVGAPSFHWQPEIDNARVCVWKFVSDVGGAPTGTCRRPHSSNKKQETIHNAMPERFDILSKSQQESVPHGPSWSNLIKTGWNSKCLLRTTLWTIIGRYELCGKSFNFPQFLNPPCSGDPCDQWGGGGGAILYMIHSSPYSLNTLSFMRGIFVLRWGFLLVLFFFCAFPSSWTHPCVCWWISSPAATSEGEELRLRRLTQPSCLTPEGEYHYSLKH